MGIDTGSNIAFNPLFPVPGVNQSSVTYRNNFAIIKKAIERLQAGASTSNSLFSVSTTQQSDGQIQFIVGFQNNSFTLPVGDPTVAPVTGSVRLSAGNIQFFNGSSWVTTANQTAASIKLALGFDPASTISPSFTGIPLAPTAANATNTNQIATTAYVRSVITDMIGAAPGALASLAALAAALNNDPNFATHLTQQIGSKADINHTHTQYLETLTAQSGSHTGNNLKINGANGLSTSITGDILTLSLDPAVAHGTLAGGTYHALAQPNGPAGFMSGPDKAKLDGLNGNGNAYSRFIVQNAVGLNVNDADNGNASFVFSSEGPIVLTNNPHELKIGFSPTNESHGYRGGGQLHSVAVANGDAGFLSGADKAKLDFLTAATATPTTKGYMSPQDKTKLDLVEIKDDTGGYTTIDVNGKVTTVNGNNVIKFEGVNGVDVDFQSGTNTLYFVLNGIGTAPIGDFTKLKENYNSGNDRLDTPIVAPTVAADGTAVDHTLSKNGSANLSFEWQWTGAENDIDGFMVYVHQSTSATPYVFGTDPLKENVIAIPAQKRSAIIYGVVSDNYYSFAVQAYRIVDKDIDANGVIYSSRTGPSVANENPYRPSAMVAFSGDVTGTIDGTAATIVASNAVDAWGQFTGIGNTLPAGNVEFNFANSTTKGGAAKNTDNVGTRPATEVALATVNFDARNDRIGTPVPAPLVPNDGTSVDHTANDDGSVNISFEWVWNGDTSLIDGFIVYVYQSATGEIYTLGQTPGREMVYYVTPEKRATILMGVPANQFYTFYVQAYRVVDNDVSSSGFLNSPATKSSRTEENPYQPALTPQFAGAITGTIGGQPAATVAQNAIDSWDKFSGVNNTLPAGNVEFGFAGSDTKGGAATNTIAVGNQTADTVQNSIINFNGRNDRNGTSISPITIPNDGTAIDHTTNTDGSVDISFEWRWSGSGDDIDGFVVTVYQSKSNSAAYTAGSYPQEESVLYVTPEKRAAILMGVASDRYYTFFVEAYRVVDKDVSSSGFIKTANMKSTAAGENPYLPSSQVAFSGNVSGTINNVPAATVQTAAQNAISKFSGTNGGLPAGNVDFSFAAGEVKGGRALDTMNVGSQSATTVQNSVINFNLRNDRNGAPVVAPYVVVDGTAIDHTLNSNGSANISFEWTWGGAIADIDGFIVYMYSGKTSAVYSFNSNPGAETVFYVTPEKRAYILYGVPVDDYYTFHVQAYRIVDVDVNPNGYIFSNAAKSLRPEENPYRPSIAPVFTGDITGTINGTNVDTVLGDIDALKDKVDAADAAAGTYSLVKNPAFSDYPTTGVPTYWSADTVGGISRVVDPLSKYAVRASGGANGSTYFAQRAGSVSVPNIVGKQFLVMEAAVRLVTGSFLGAGAMTRIMNTSDGAAQDLYLQFAVDNDSTGFPVGNGVAGKTYTFTKLVQVTSDNPAFIYLYGHAHFPPLGNVSTPNVIDFLRLTVRPASQGEIETRVASTTLEALKSTVGTYSGILADLEGRTSAYLTLQATSGVNAKAFVKIETASSPTENTSSVSIGAEEFFVLNPSNNGYIKALSVTDGNVQIYGTLQADSIVTRMLKVGSITTDTIAQQAVTKSGLAANPSTITAQGFGTQQSYYNPATGEVMTTLTGAITICSYNLVLDAVSNVYVIVNAKQDYTDGAKRWNAYIYIDGVPIQQTGGGSKGVTDCLTLSTALINQQPGVYNIQFRWANESSSVRLMGTTMFVQAAKR
jgi:hypothetical protein